MSSSMERLLLACLCELGFRRRTRRGVAFLNGRIGLERRLTPLVDGADGNNGFGRPLGSAFTWLYAGDFLRGCRDPGEWRAEIRQIDHGKQQARYPKNMHMCEQGNETQDSNNLELQLVGSMRHALGQGMQPKEHNAEHQDGERQE